MEAKEFILNRDTALEGLKVEFHEVIKDTECDQSLSKFRERLEKIFFTLTSWKEENCSINKCGDEIDSNDSECPLSQSKEDQVTFISNANTKTELRPNEN